MEKKASIYLYFYIRRLGKEVGWVLHYLLRYLAASGLGCLGLEGVGKGRKGGLWTAGQGVMELLTVTTWDFWNFF